MAEADEKRRFGWRRDLPDFRDYTIKHDQLSFPKEQYGYERIPQKRFKIALPSSVTPEVDMMVFRFSSAGRIAGYRINDVFHIVVVGPNHELY